MEKRNKVALSNLIHELEELSKRSQLDNLGDQIIESHQIKQALDTLKPNISDNELKDLKARFRDAGDQLELKLKSSQANIEFNDLSTNIQETTTEQDHSKDKDNIDFSRKDELILEKPTTPMSSDTQSSSKTPRRKRSKKNRHEDQFKSVDLLSYLEILQDSMTNLVTENEVMLALKTLVKFKSDSISVSELRYLLTQYGNIPVSEVDSMILLATGVKKLNQVTPDKKIDFQEFVDKLFAIA